MSGLVFVGEFSDFWFLLSFLDLRRVRCALVSWQEVLLDFYKVVALRSPRKSMILDIRV